MPHLISLLRSHFASLIFLFAIIVCFAVAAQVGSALSATDTDSLSEKIRGNDLNSSDGDATFSNLDNAGFESAGDGEDSVARDVAAADPPVLGTYPVISNVVLSGNTTIAPSSTPVGVTSINASTNPKFAGILTADPATGIVRITNANPAGNYSIIVMAFGPGGTTTTSFDLNVTSGTQCNGEVAFATPSPSGVNVNAPVHALALGDFNNDSNQDLLISSNHESNIRLFLGVGDGTFLVTGTPIPIGSPNVPRVADVNNDGKQDFVVANPDSETVSVRLGDGAGGFTSPAIPQFVISGDLTGVILKDFNLDGKADLLIGKFGSPNEVRLGDGLGGFGSPTEVIATIGAIANLNNDNIPDIISPAGVAIYTYLGDGSGGFTLGGGAGLSSGYSPASVTPGEFIGDGNQDAVFPNISNASFTLLQGNGLGGVALQTPSFPVTGFPSQILPSDLNRDGKQDLLIFRSSSGFSVAIRLGDGVGGFTTPTNSEVVTSGSHFLATVADFNNDEKQDFAVGLQGTATTTVRLGECLMAEMNVTGNGQSIANGDGLPTIADHTDFGSTLVSGGTVVRTFTIQNLGNASLNLTGTPRIVSSGTNASEFTVTMDPTSPIAGPGSTTFQVTFDPGGAGLRTSNLIIENDDFDENPYEFSIQGTGSAETPTNTATATATSTPSLPPLVTTNAASSVAGTTASLNGTANPNGDSTTGWFRYSSTNPGTCNDSFGTRAPASGGSALGAGTSPVAYSQGITGLNGTTTYYFCAIAQNGIGTSFGAVLSFTTSAAGLPTATTNAASSVAGTTATLNGTANPNGDSTTGWFRYSSTNPGTCNDSFGTRAPSSGGSALGAGTSAVAYSQGITGLNGTTTYYFCAIAQNGIGTSFGAVLSFTTLAAGVPLATTNAASSVAGTTATLNGTANPNGDATTGWFRYSSTNPGTCNDTFGIRAPASGGSALGSGTSAVAYSQGITSLSGTTTYYFCAIAQNGVGTSFGAVLSFTTPTPLPLEPTSWDFGSVTVGSSSSPQTFTITNNGPGIWTINGVSTISGNPIDFLPNTPTLPITLALGESTTFTVTFSPGDVGPRGTFLALDQTRDPSVTASVSGTGVAATPTSTPTPSETPSISGSITYGNAIGNPAPPRFVKNVSLSSTAGSPSVGPVITGTPGTYTLTGFGAGSYTIKPTKPGGSNGAITSNDAARVAQGVVSSPAFVSQNQRFAADTSGNGNVTSNDAALIARFAAGLTGAGNAGQWKFFVTGAPSPLPTPPQTYNDSRTYASVTSNLTGEDYVAILVGEVSGNWNPATHPRPVGSRQLAVGSGREGDVAVELPQVVAVPEKEIIIPVTVQGAADKEIISYEFNLRYDPTVIQPLGNPVDVAGTVSRGLFVVANPHEPGLLRVVVYGPMPIDEDGVLLNLRFSAVGGVGSITYLKFENLIFNEGEPRVTVAGGRVELF